MSVLLRRLRVIPVLPVYVAVYFLFLYLPILLLPIFSFNNAATTTFPLAGLASAIMFWLGHSIGGVAGALVVFAVLVAGSWWMFRKSQENRIDHSNVTAEWDRPADVLDQHAPDHAGSHESPTSDLKG